MAADTPIQPIRSGSESASPQGSFQGTVTGVKRENGAQTVEIQSTQGRVKLQAEGEFQVGEKVRVFMPQGGSVRLEKMQQPAETAGHSDWRGVSWQMAGNIDTLKSVRAFEEQLVNWVARRQLGGGAGSGPNPGKGGLAAALGGNEADALLRLPLPELLKRVLAREGGREFLMQALSTLGKEGFASLMAGLEEGQGGPAESGKASLLALLRNMGRDIDAGRAGTAGGAAGQPQQAASRGQVTGQDMGAFWPGGAKGEDGKVSPWMGRILERSDLGGNLAFAGGKPIPYAPNGRAGVDPMFRYMLDLGGRTLEVQSHQAAQAGDLVDFEMENAGTGHHGVRLQAKFLDPAQALPVSLRTAFAEASPEGKAALQVAARYLEGFKGEPYHDRLVKDFGDLLAQSGRLAAPPAGQALRAGQMPGPKELDNLLRLFVAFPRDAEQPERQARTWSEASRDPKAMMELLRAMKPEGDTSLLRSGTPLRPALGQLPGSLGPLANNLPPELLAALAKGEGGTGGEEDAMVTLLRKVLPEGFKSADALDLARQLASGDTAKASAPEAKAAQFLMQAFAGLVPREEELREGKPNQFYFFQNQDWKGLQVTWERERQSNGRPKRDANAPIKMRVETQAQHMGKVDVAVVAQGKDDLKITLDFRNQFHDVREILAEQMPELEKGLAALGVHVEGWIYSQIPDQPTVLPTAGWVRPASLDGGNLDLTG